MRTLKRYLMDPVESTLLQVPRALIASILALALDVGLMALLKEVLGWNPVLAAAVGYMAGVVLQYVLCTVWVFAGAPSNNAGFAVFTLFSLVGLGITVGLIRLCAEVGFSEYLGKIVAVGIAFSWNFLSRKWLLFRASRSVYELELPDCPSVELTR